MSDPDRGPRRPRGDGALAVETRGLTKRFGKRAAVESLDLAVPAGSVFGFLGPNGSGKTTTIRMLLGLINPTEGDVRLFGETMPAAAASVLPRVGALVEGPGFAPYLSGTANLRRLDSADRRTGGGATRVRIEAALERVGLTAAAGKKVKAYSLGMKQRLGIANALLRPRDLLILDEPTNGLDPQGTREVRTLVRALADGGTTVFVSSHLLAEIEQLCTHAAVMRSGRLVAQGTLDELRQRGRPVVQVVTPDPEAAREVLERAGLSPIPMAAGHDAGDALVSAVLAASAVPEQLVADLVDAGVRVRGFQLLETSLEDRFVALTGEGFDVES
ncbi:ATP-binding cassette domain-containing protein [uncultured Amnibacterium sp.]|uniref:ABC transporter ATP-binding protein n=1 Tax=uncultured Amnibacterium sp. TaxID=1631851 RepID=UPI0035CB925F